jgi:hypothetical protein
MMTAIVFCCMVSFTAVAQEESEPDPARLQAYRDAISELNNSLPERLETEGRAGLLQDYQRLLEEYNDLPQSVEAARQIATLHATPIGPDDTPNYDAAVEQYLRLLEAYPETSPEVRQQQTSILVHLQGIQQQSGQNYDWAVQQAADYLIATYPDDLAVQATSAWHVGKSAETNGDFERAEFWYAEERRVALASEGRQSEHLLVHADAALFWLAIRQGGDDPAAQLAAIEAMAAKYPGFLDSMTPESPPMKRLAEIEAQMGQQKTSGEAAPSAAVTAASPEQQGRASRERTVPERAEAATVDASSVQPPPEPASSPAPQAEEAAGHSQEQTVSESQRSLPFATVLVVATLALAALLLAAGVYLKGR